jgi:glucokinase
MLASAYGAEAGNMALRAVARAGVYIGGGVAPKILPVLQSGLFIEAFRDKGEMASLVARIPVRVIMNPDAGLLGAAMHAQSLCD